MQKKIIHTIILYYLNNFFSYTYGHIKLLDMITYIHTTLSNKNTYRSKNKNNLTKYL
jgi:hypothetical protein